MEAKGVEVNEQRHIISIHTKHRGVIMSKKLFALLLLAAATGSVYAMDSGKDSVVDPVADPVADSKSEDQTETAPRLDRAKVAWNYGMGVAGNAKTCLSDIAKLSVFEEPASAKARWFSSSQNKRLITAFGLWGTALFAGFKLYKPVKKAYRKIRGIKEEATA